MTTPVDREKQCFFISPIGEEASEVRARADRVLKYVVRPVCEDLGYCVTRADEVEKPGLITKNVLHTIATVDLVVADLTGRNPNVYYELALRHVTCLPLVQIIDKNEKLPFDVFDFRTIQFDHTDLDSVDQCKNKLRRFIHAAETQGFVDNPASEFFHITQHANGESEDASLADVNGKLDSVLRDMASWRADRSLIFDALLRDHIGKRYEPSHDETIPNVAGTWEAVHRQGPMSLAQHGSDVFGEYKYNSDQWVGELIGKIVGNKLIGKWSWRTTAARGYGYLTITDTCLKGAWWYSDDPGGLIKILSDPALLASQAITDGNDWEFRRVSKTGANKEIQPTK